MSMSPVCVGVDPGKVCGVVALLRRRLIWATTIRGDILPQVAASVQLIVELAAKHGGATVAIELQHGARGKKVNYKSLDTLYRRRHEWETLLQLYSIPVVQVWPATWQSQLTEVPRLDGKGKVRDTKTRSKELARQRFGDRIVDDAQADAALIARWLTNQPGQAHLPLFEAPQGKNDGT